MQGKIVTLLIIVIVDAAFGITAYLWANTLGHYITANPLVAPLVTSYTGLTFILPLLEYIVPVGFYVGMVMLPDTITKIRHDDVNITMLLLAENGGQ